MAGTLVSASAVMLTVTNPDGTTSQVAGTTYTYSVALVDYNGNPIPDSAGVPIVVSNCPQVPDSMPQTYTTDQLATNLSNTQGRITDFTNAAAALQTLQAAATNALAAGIGKVVSLVPAAPATGAGTNTTAPAGK